MKPLYRLLLSVVFAIGYVLATMFYLWIKPLMHFNSIFWSAALVFTIVNLFISFFYLKASAAFNIIASCLIAYLALSAAFRLSDLRLFPSDAYGILTTIISNIVFSIVLWEVAFRIKRRFTSGGGPGT